MKRASWVLRATSGAVLCGGLLSCTSLEPETAPPGLIHLTHAQVAKVSPGDLSAMPPQMLGPLPSLAWMPTALPYAPPRAVVPNPTGTDVTKMASTTTWFRLTLAAAAVTDDLNALYLARWHTWGNLAIYANGELVYNSEEDRSDSPFNVPLLARLPAGLTRGNGLEIIVRMDSVSVVGGALSSIWLGSATKLHPMFETRRLWQNRMPQITSSIFLVLGVFALAFWLRRRQATTQLLFFALSVLFYIRNLHYYIDTSLLPDEWFTWMTINSLGWLIVVVCWFAFRLQTHRYRLVERVLTGAMILASLISMPLGWLNASLGLMYSLAYLIFIGVSFGVTSLLTYAALKSRSREYGLLAMILWLNIGLGVHDWLLQNWRLNLESVYLLPFGVLALFVMFLASVLRDYLAALSASERASSLLEVRLADRERELGESYAKLRAVEQAQLLSQERQRLMREMHDGLGSALMSSLVAVERGQMQPGDIAQVLRECVDDLKLTIDSLEPVGDDLLVLLATLRYRLEPRLQAAGIRLSWEVESVPRLAWLNPGAALNILRMMQEILTNILKHARAQSIRVTTQRHDDHVAITIADDGVGFDSATMNDVGRGLKNLQRRAADIGGQVDIRSGPGGTRIQIRLPIEGRRS
jgi:signal transduction histidine kinase